MASPLSQSDKIRLLRLARLALETAVRRETGPAVDVVALSPALRQAGCCFVTLTRGGQLRGCIGGLLPERALYEDVRQRAAQAALQDYRFPSVAPAELPEIELEISVLSAPQRVAYSAPAELPSRLRPGVDGLILRHGSARATFLPQVWERVPEPERFVSLLCEKLGLPPLAWRQMRLEAHTYQVEKFAESEFDVETGIDDTVSSRAP